MNWQPAHPDDKDEILELVRSFYQEEGLPFELTTAARAVGELLDSNDQGLILLYQPDHRTGGYLVATLGFSIEFGGRFILLDELYLSPGFRGRGAWKEGLRQIEEWAALIGISSIRLEVNHHNETAHRIYLKAGFQSDQRHILTKRLDHS